MQAGKLDRKIILKNPTVTRDTWGGATESFETLATVWANVSYAGGESMPSLYSSESERINVKDSTQFTIRYRSDVDMETQIIYKDVAYRIEGIRESSGRDAYLHILAARIRNT